MRQLEQESQKAGDRLEEVVARGEVLLSQIQSALADIAQSQLDMQHSIPSQVANGNVTVNHDNNGASSNGFQYANTNSLPDTKPTLSSGY